MDSDTRQAARPTPGATVSRILITGISGMDGSLMAEILLSQGCEVYGLVRRSASTNHWRIAHFMHHPKLPLIEGDLTAPDSVYRAIQTAEPEYVYHLASQSFVPYSWASPAHTLQVTTMGTINVLVVLFAPGVKKPSKQPLAYLGYPLSPSSGLVPKLRRRATSTSSLWRSCPRNSSIRQKEVYC